MVAAAIGKYALNGSTSSRRLWLMFMKTSIISVHLIFLIGTTRLLQADQQLSTFPAHDYEERPCQE